MGNTGQHFDYIIVGAGCSGLSLAVRMIECGSFCNKKILLVDKAPHSGNDKTWCFWDNGGISSFWKAGSIIYKEWPTLWVKHDKGKMLLDIAPYAYKMVRSGDFYKYCYNLIRKASNIQLQFGEVTHMDPATGTISMEAATFTAPVIFSSVLISPPVLQQNDYYLLQHFRGWWIETDTDCFNPREADLMNFRTSQANGCTFLYVLPVSRRKALVEYTLFSETELEDDQYNEGLSEFIEKELKISTYTILEKEQGIIPMTNMAFPGSEGKVFFIGTAGGQTKASTGYTFSFIQKQSEWLVQSMQQNGMPGIFRQPARFQFYDTILLSLLCERKAMGADIFYRMFKKNKPAAILRFLDNESNLVEELKIMNTTNKFLFVPAAIKTFLKLIFRR